MNRATEEVSQQFSMAELLAHALVIELEAVQSYLDLAAQMHECGNDPVARLFSKMAEYEQEHADKIRTQAGDIKLPEFAPWEYRWRGLEPPENIDIAGIHYLMTPHQALKLALENEMSAMEFFEEVAGNSTDAKVRSLAGEFAEDEREHVAWMEEWLAEYPSPDAGWDDDPDPPVAMD
jgi:rubrerythrin